MMIRGFDICFSFIGLIILSPIWVFALLLVWLEDKKNPLYISQRIGLNGELFKMYKIRTMIINADKTGVDTTSLHDLRLTKIGKFIRKFKIDELVQLFNVLNGTMSFVGPRPNVQREVDIYTKEELVLLSVKPGITDFSSIVFSDLSEIMANEKDPNIAYNQLVRPWKSRLGIFYVNNQSLGLYFLLILLTLISFISRKTSLRYINRILIKFRLDDELIQVCKRESKLYPTPPPGSDKIITSR